ncbi:family 16 glycoside hydrolase [Albibacterium bauzanense]|uniref:Uncharacterized protein DUF1080 n=1 Tax=Albibacterium bauzanense TaxID=653929 RepID=A0A4R1LZG5_9SPHI|nr:family 16 glycoside hydrolase [Albibacterium bauzanense]TCK82629.1 uncharacterized protein DUF1080 [Albibacterium bauzanense]
MKKVVLLLLGSIICSNYVFSQSSVPTSNFDAFEKPGENWLIVSDLITDFNKSTTKFVKGNGIVVNTPMKGATNLVSGLQLEGDTEIDFDFLTTNGSNSAVYIMGRYKIQLSDSWPESQNPLSRIGTIDVNKAESSISFHTKQPISNVGKAPGLWQHLKVKFKSPTFDSSGKKVDKASFAEVYLNGVLIHQGISLEGPSDGAIFNDESTKGPLVFQADENHVLAFRNISYKSFEEPVQQLTGDAARRFRMVNPIIVEAKAEPYVLRSYLLFDNGKRTHVISVGNPNHTNYSYDLKQGSILQFWRGGFVDATDMWESRGEPQLATPLGALITLSSAPSVALLSNSDSIWPDSIPFDDFHNKGYSLDNNKNVTFHYEYSGFNVDDKISMVANGESLIREVSVTNAPTNLYFRIASGKVIESLGKGLYVIDGKSYYIKVNERLKPIIRKSRNADELVIAFSKNISSLEYSIIW